MTSISNTSFARRLVVKGMMAGALLAAAISLPAQASVDVSGYKFEDTAKVAGKDLKLNGAGMRTKLIIKVYAAGLYLPEKKTATADIMKLEGPRRVTLQMARDISSEDFGKAFMDGLNENVDKAEKQKIVAQIGKMGELFASVDALKKGDVLHLDWIPGTGTQAELNGKKLGDPIPDINFYNAILRIWLGDKPVDRSLKPALLGEAK
ncbi:chalcone isomerase family protein [Massilia sp. 2TAF26]|uniref:chalcone isomerase family protein n=1 Tax=Massilia sp. 2TAF26 TaxID=3233012 RepID=UPI003F995BE7